MPVIIALVAGLIGWALFTGKIRSAQLPPILLAAVGGFILLRGGLLIGIGAIALAATWYRGQTWRLFGVKGEQSEQYHIDKARFLLGVGSRDDADYIRARHRKLIAENHPDTGGSDARASALNEARDLLLAALAKDQ